LGFEASQPIHDPKNSEEPTEVFPRSPARLDAMIVLSFVQKVDAAIELHRILDGAAGALNSCIP
jgi:hypothetical protein